MRNGAFFIVLCAAFFLTAASQASSPDPSKEADPLYKEPPQLEADEAPALDLSGASQDPLSADGQSVRVHGELEFGSRQNIDGFLGEFENPYAPPESTYEGSRSEARQDENRPGFLR